MVTKIVSVPFSRIPKLEFTELVNSVAETVGKYNPSAMHIDDANNLLLESKAQLSTLVVIKSKSEESKMVESLRERRLELLQGMVGHVKTAEKSKLPSQKALLVLVAPIMNTYWAKVRRYTIKTTAERLRQMLDELDANSELRAAFSSIGLSEYTDELRQIQSSLLQHSVEKKRQKSTVSMLKTNEVKLTLSETLKDLCHSIELASKANKDVDYNPMINELNFLFTTYNTLIKTKMTRNKNASQASAKANDSKQEVA